MTRTVLAATVFAMISGHAMAATSAPVQPDRIVAPGSYCEWVMTFEEGSDDRPSWCGDAAEQDG